MPNINLPVRASHGTSTPVGGRRGATPTTPPLLPGAKAEAPQDVSAPSEVQSADVFDLPHHKGKGANGDHPITSNGHKPFPLPEYKAYPPRLRDLECAEFATSAEPLPQWDGSFVAEPMSASADRRVRGSRLRLVNAGDLQRRALSGESPQVERLPFLGNLAVSPFLRGWAHLVAAYPKVGKTELMARLVTEWGGLGTKTAYFSEEPEFIWLERLRSLSAVSGWDNVEVGFAIGQPTNAILEAIKSTNAEVVVIDTLRLLNIATNLTSDFSLTGDMLSEVKLDARVPDLTSDGPLLYRK